MLLYVLVLLNVPSDASGRRSRELLASTERAVEGMELEELIAEKSSQVEDWTAKCTDEIERRLAMCNNNEEISLIFDASVNAFAILFEFSDQSGHSEQGTQSDIFLKMEFEQRNGIHSRRSFDQKLTLDRGTGSRLSATIRQTAFSCHFYMIVK